LQQKPFINKVAGDLVTAYGTRITLEISLIRDFLKFKTSFKAKHCHWTWSINAVPCVKLLGHLQPLVFPHFHNYARTDGDIQGKQICVYKNP